MDKRDYCYVLKISYFIYVATEIVISFFQVAGSCEKIVTMLPNNDIVKAVYQVENPWLTSFYHSLLNKLLIKLIVVLT